MSDLKIVANGGDGLAVDWGLVIENGDLALTASRTEEVAQRVVYRLQTWLSESIYDTSAGVPYLDGVFGFQPREGVAALLIEEIRNTPGVDEIVDNPEFLLEGNTLTLYVIIRVSGEDVPITFAVGGET